MKRTHVQSGHCARHIYQESEGKTDSTCVTRNLYENGREEFAARRLKLSTVMNYKKSEYVEMGQLKRDEMKSSAVVNKLASIFFSFLIHHPCLYKSV
jgi:hypothetical protein